MKNLVSIQMNPAADHIPLDAANVIILELIRSDAHKLFCVARNRAEWAVEDEASARRKLICRSLLALVPGEVN